MNKMTKREIAERLEADRKAAREKVAAKARVEFEKRRAQKAKELAREIAELKKIVSGKKPFSPRLRVYLADLEQKLEKLR